MTEDPKPSRDYLDTLQLYYEEEIEGEAFFAAIAERLEDRTEREKMQLMADVETRAAAAVAPLLQKHGLTPRDRDELHANGRKQAGALKPDYAALIAEWQRDFPEFMDDFEGLEAMAPAEDLPALKVLTAHEVAAIRFLDAEVAGKADSAAPLRTYLETGTA